MSGGAGEVMSKLLLFVAACEDEVGTYPTYPALAVMVYAVQRPSRAQLSAVARAARRLEADGIVEIYALAADNREKVVGISPWARLAVTIIGEGVKAAGTSSWYQNLKVVTAAVRDLATAGIIEGFEGDEQIDPRQRRLVRDVEPVRATASRPPRAGRGG